MWGGILEIPRRGQLLNVLKDARLASDTFNQLINFSSASKNLMGFEYYKLREFIL